MDTTEEKKEILELFQTEGGIFNFLETWIEKKEIFRNDKNFIKDITSIFNYHINNAKDTFGKKFNNFSLYTQDNFYDKSFMNEKIIKFYEKSEGRNFLNYARVIGQDFGASFEIEILKGMIPNYFDDPKRINLINFWTLKQLNHISEEGLQAISNECEHFNRISKKNFYQTVMAFRKKSQENILNEAEDEISISIKKKINMFALMEEKFPQMDFLIIDKSMTTDIRDTSKLNHEHVIASTLNSYFKEAQNVINKQYDKYYSNLHPVQVSETNNHIFIEIKVPADFGVDNANKFFNEMIKNLSPTALLSENNMKKTAAYSFLCTMFPAQTMDPNKINSNEGSEIDFKM